ncbi:MAG: signal recognition particle-docking protein FtsY [Coriobacteriia bacterium]|nr:signal recognition particle-docking protein FtsY [Coriobacteriia bacterium]MBS5478949.1 signal recognition particle-docking protein FtsY [Coriobacteriia bacterium]
MGWFQRLSEGLSKTRKKITGELNVLFELGPKVGDEFWDDLEATLIMSDIGAGAAEQVTSQLREISQREELTGVREVNKALVNLLAEAFTPCESDPFDDTPSCVLFVGVNGAGKTTTVGKIASEAKDRGLHPIIGSADTFRAAAIEQLDVWGERAGVQVVKRERGADPASVCYDTLDAAERQGSNLVLIDTAGRLQTSTDLMRELQKVVQVTRKRAQMPVHVVLVIDSTTGQNGLSQAGEFNKALGIDGVIMTKLDGTAKGGIALAVSHDLHLPILRVGVGETIEDLRPFDAHEFAQALITGQED